MIAAIEASVGNNDSVNITEKQNPLRGHRFKRCCCVFFCGPFGCYFGYGPGYGPGYAPGHGIQPGYEKRGESGGATGQKEMFRNWWLHISLSLLPISMSWMKSMFY
uniref:Uncharacterized protein n=1 Tax=Onchocerca volvulus TaxID=6282 RepID=A0A8R1TMQ4_ONCVO